MSMPRVVTEIDRLKAALKLANSQNLDLIHAREDMRAQLNEAHMLMVQAAKALRVHVSEIDSLRNQLDDALDRIAELEEGQQ